MRKRASNLLIRGKPLLAAGHAVAAVCQQLRQHQVREALARLPGVGEVQMFGARITACVSGCARTA